MRTAGTQSQKQLCALAGTAWPAPPFYRWPCGPRPKGPARARQIWPGPNTARPGQNRARASPTRTPCSGLGRTPRPWASTARHGSCKPGRRRPANFHRPQPSPHTHPLQTLDLSLPDPPGRPEWRSPAPLPPQAQRPPLLVAAAPPRRLWAVASSPSPAARGGNPATGAAGCSLSSAAASPARRSSSPPRRPRPPRLRASAPPDAASSSPSGSLPRRSQPPRLRFSAPPVGTSAPPHLRLADHRILGSAAPAAASSSPPAVCRLLISAAAATSAATESSTRSVLLGRGPPDLCCWAGLFRAGPARKWPVGSCLGRQGSPWAGTARPAEQLGRARHGPLKNGLGRARARAGPGRPNGHL